uniref:Zinc finger-XS domain-containing protein n=1 Tax=Kalanchoe fedtschenkoi TaxID=63787 RepID=A0A7N0RCQ3_KALFE
MSSKKGFSSGSGSASSKGKKVEEALTVTVEQLGHSVSDVKFDSVADGDWEVYSKKSKGRTAAGSATNNRDSHKSAAMGNSGRGSHTGSAWSGVPVDPQRPAGRGNGRPQPPNHTLPNNYRASAAVQPPLKNGWNWASVAGSGTSRELSNSGNYGSAPHDDRAGIKTDEEGDDGDDDSALDDSDDDLASDEFDSDVSQKSHETRKKNRWFKKFFESLDGLTQEEINEPGRQWHCPACQGGPGAIDWFRGLQPLMTHAKTKGAKRVKLHREFADLLDEELYRRGTTAYPSGEQFGKWKGLTQKTPDHEIACQFDLVANSHLCCRVRALSRRVSM